LASKKKKSGNGWEKYQLLVLERLDNLNEGQDNLWKVVNALRIDLNNYKVASSSDISALKVKAGIFGAVSGLISTAIGLCAAVLAYLKTQ